MGEYSKICKEYFIFFALADEVGIMKQDGPHYRLQLLLLLNRVHETPLARVLVRRLISIAALAA